MYLCFMNRFQCGLSGFTMSHSSVWIPVYLIPSFIFAVAYSVVLGVLQMHQIVYVIYTVSQKKLCQIILSELCQQFRTSAFYTVVCWHKLGEVENECTSHKFILIAVFVPEIFTVGGNLTRVLTKIILHSFFETRCSTKSILQSWLYHIRKQNWS